MSGNRARGTEAVPAVWHALCGLAGLDEASRRRLWRGLAACPDGKVQAVRLLFVRLVDSSDYVDLYRRFLDGVRPIIFCEGLEAVVATRPDLRAAASQLQNYMCELIDHRGQWRYEPLDLAMP